MYGVGAAENFADITCRKGLKNRNKIIKTKKHLEQMLVPLIKKHLKEKPKQTPRVIMTLRSSPSPHVSVSE